jgi:RHS repeat-associated protein
LEGAGGIGGLLSRTASEISNLQSPSHAYYHADGNGNVTALIASNQTIAARYLYDPYGNQLAATGPLAEANLYRFSSKEWHPASGLVYYGYRFYDPGLHRWVNSDPILEAGGFNLFVFTLNNPLNTVDDYGHAGSGTVGGGGNYTYHRPGYAMPGYTRPNGVPIHVIPPKPPPPRPPPPKPRLCVVIPFSQFTRESIEQIHAWEHLQELVEALLHTHTQPPTGRPTIFTGPWIAPPPGPLHFPPPPPEVFPWPPIKPLHSPPTPVQVLHFQGFSWPAVNAVPPITIIGVPR